MEREKKGSIYLPPWKTMCLILLLTCFGLQGCSAFFTVVPIQEENAVSESAGNTNKGFDKVAYVDNIWGSKILPAFKEKPIEFSTLYSALNLNRDEASQKFGNKVGGPYNFMVRFEGTVEEINTTSRNGTLVVETKSNTGPVLLTVQIGPVIRGTAIRDAVGFIPFNDFVNQLQFADVADELNTRAYNLSLKNLDLTTLKGKTISVSGAFTLDKLDKITVMPVYLEVK